MQEQKQKITFLKRKSRIYAQNVEQMLAAIQPEERAKKKAKLDQGIISIVSIGVAFNTFCIEIEAHHISSIPTDAWQMYGHLSVLNKNDGELKHEHTSEPDSNYGNFCLSRSLIC